jgi:signal transduction histidine kinase
VTKHASASHIRIEYTAGQIAIVDDGCGFDPSAVREGYGLPGLRNRAASYGGTVIVSSAPGAGTTVRVTLPSGAGT